MFKDAYRKKNDTIHVREGLLDDIKAERVQRVRDEQKKKERRRQWLIAIPAVAAAAAACVAVVVGIRAGSSRSAAPMASEQSAAAGIVQAYGDMDAAYPEEAAAASVPATVGSYEELGKIMQERYEKRRSSAYGYYGISDEMIAEAEAPTAAEPIEIPVPQPTSPALEIKSADSVNGSGRNYSGTNVQVEDVDEADIVKTDGLYIYALNQSKGKVYILSAEGRDTKIVSSIKLSEPSGKSNSSRYYGEMMLYGDRLYLLGTQSDWGNNVKEQDRVQTFAEVYDISDPAKPALIATHKQQGSYRTARLIDDILLIVSDYRIYPIFFDDTVPTNEIGPKVATNSEAIPLAPDEIYVNPDSGENGFTVVTTLRAGDGKEFDSHKAVLGGCTNVYCSGTDLLIASDEYTSDRSDEQTAENGRHFVKIVSGSKTNLFRFTIRDGKIEAAATAKLPGSLLNQFSMDAYNGYYRLVVTRSDSEEIIWTDGIDTYEWTNSSDCALYVLDGNLNTVGSIEELAKDERVQSVRFMGDTAYFVTFRQVDPLFAADLSDPANPKVLSALKIPGFSAYLHPFGEGKLLGIGYDADEEHGWTENVKLSMFDISDPANVKEAFKLSVKDAHFTSVQSNHKTVFVDVNSGTVAFLADNTYLVFRADEKGFTEVGRIETEIVDWFDGNARGLFVDDAFYVINQSEVVILSFETMEKIASVKLK
ncbi:MAG: beta-propeller domain-containing protein [Clostridia bacterium]|nr:beta-propeller domain-containing protein [Clostridia bacterium]